MERLHKVPITVGVLAKDREEAQLKAVTEAVNVPAGLLLKVYIVIEDGHETTTKLVTTNLEGAHSFAQGLMLEKTGLDGEGLVRLPAPESMPNGTIYTSPDRDYFVRVEEHEVQP